MGDFHLGDRVEWITQKTLDMCGGSHFKTGVVINLLDYEGENQGVIEIILDDCNDIQSIPAAECRLYKVNTWEDTHNWHDGIGFPPSDVY